MIGAATPSYTVFRVKGMQKFRASVFLREPRALHGEASAAASLKGEGKPHKVNRGLNKTAKKGIS